MCLKRVAGNIEEGGNMGNFTNELKKLYEIEERSRITVGELKEKLQGYPDDTEITFGSNFKPPETVLSF
jgi:hypothetical protein